MKSLRSLLSAGTRLTAIGKTYHMPKALHARRPPLVAKLRK